MAQANTSTIVVRIAVARFESICATPILARMAVAAAKSAESNAQTIQLLENVMLLMVSAGATGCFKLGI